MNSWLRTLVSLTRSLDSRLSTSASRAWAWPGDIFLCEAARHTHTHMQHTLTPDHLDTPTCYSLLLLPTNTLNLNTSLLHTTPTLHPNTRPCYSLLLLPTHTSHVNTHTDSRCTHPPCTPTTAPATACYYCPLTLRMSTPAPPIATSNRTEPAIGSCCQGAISPGCCQGAISPGCCQEAISPGCCQGAISPGCCQGPFPLVAARGHFPWLLPGGHFPWLLQVLMKVVSGGHFPWLLQVLMKVVSGDDPSRGSHASIMW